MKHPRLWITLAFCLLLATVPVASSHAQGLVGLLGASYVTTVNDSQGNFASRGVISLHAGGTMSVTDSGQGGPAFFFSSQLGSWKLTKTGAVARAIDFDYPPNADVARIDYTITFGSTPGQISGTITLTTFPLDTDPQGSGGTVVGTFTFTGEYIKP